MAAQSTAHDDDAIVGINVTPLVDIVLVLLIVFMVTAKLMPSTAVPLDLPRAATAGATQTVFAVSVDPEGHASIDGAPLRSDDELRARASEALQKDSALRTVVQASRRTSHGDVIHVVDELRRAGITKVAFGAER